jgi:ABC-type sulfate/molybdate transport systems ATPase subunit
VRPHDVELKNHPRAANTADAADAADVASIKSVEDAARATSGPATSDGSGAQPSVATAQIERMSRVGWMVKMELRMADGQPLSVEITKDRVAELGVVEGDRVLVNLKDAKVFVQDYAI